MSLEQVNLVKSTWQKVAPIAGQAAALFYGRLSMLAGMTKNVQPVA